LSTLLVASATEFMFMIMKKIGAKNRAGDPELLAIGVCDATARSKAICGFFLCLSSALRPTFMRNRRSRTKKERACRARCRSFEWCGHDLTKFRDNGGRKPNAFLHDGTSGQRGSQSANAHPALLRRIEDQICDRVGQITASIPHIGGGGLARLACVATIFLIALLRSSPSGISVMNSAKAA
jgi:hypothetical protein